MVFSLHPSLAVKSLVTDLPLCRVLLEDVAAYPWLMLVPRVAEVSRLIDLTAEQQQVFLRELDLAQRVLWELFEPTQLNVAAIGNKTPQLHVHVIARFGDDPAWPATVWDHPYRAVYPAGQKAKVLDDLARAFAARDWLRS